MDKELIKSPENTVRFYQSTNYTEEYIYDCLPIAIANFLVLHNVDNKIIEGTTQYLREHHSSHSGPTLADLTTITESSLCKATQQLVSVTLLEGPCIRKDPTIIITEFDHCFHAWVYSAQYGRIEADGKTYDTLIPVHYLLQIHSNLL